MGLEFLLLVLLIAGRVRRHAGRKLAAAIFLLPLTAAAVEPDSGRGAWYVGANAAAVRNDAGGREMDARLAAQGYTTSTALDGQSRHGWSLAAGYEWRRFAAELGYVDLGRMDSRVTGFVPVDEDYLLAIREAHPRSGEGPQMGMRVRWPFGEKLSIEGHVGLFYWKNTQSARDTAQSVRGADRKLDPMMGAGLHYAFATRWALCARGNLYRLDGERLVAIELGLIRHFSSRR